MFGWSVAISGNTDVIGDHGDDERGINSGSSYVYTKIDRKWTENGNIVPEDGADNYWFDNIFALSGNTNLFGAPVTCAGEEN